MVAHPRLRFEKFFSQCEKHRWKLDQDVAWSSLRRELVSGEELETLRLAALTEGFSPTYIADLLDLYCDDPNSPPYTFFLLNGDMELNRNRKIFV